MHVRYRYGVTEIREKIKEAEMRNSVPYASVFLFELASF
jgi:hypothetical protein